MRLFNSVAPCCDTVFQIFGEQHAISSVMRFAPFIFQKPFDIEAKLKNIEKYRPTGRGSHNNASPISPALTGIGYTVADLAQYVNRKDFLSFGIS